MQIAPSTLYYDGLAVDKTKFTDALVRVSEDYVGVHLKRMTEEKVTAEFKYSYKGEEILSIDWFVKLPQCLILVESKSLRMTLGERLGRPPKDSGVLPTLKHAFEQIDRDMRELKKNKGFDHLPRELPLLGMVVTAEPIYLANSPLVRTDLPESVAPIIVISHRELARIVTVRGGALGDALLQVVNDDDRKTWGVMESLSHVFPKNENPVLREATNQLPIFNLQQHKYD